MVCPDALTAELPFGALMVEDGAFLLETLNVVYLPDPAWLLSREADGSQRLRPGLLLVGDVQYSVETLPPSAPPDLASRGGAPWSSIAGTAEEIAAVSKTWATRPGQEEPPRTLAGNTASEAAVTSQLGSYGTIHLATHGFYSSAAASEPSQRERLRLFPSDFAGLVFAGANDPHEAGEPDGVLTGSEIQRLGRFGCDLVFLSACSTSLGAIRAGEGMMSLRRAFHVAGARSVISTLWAISDLRTPEFAAWFYERLWNDGMSKSDALRTAQLEYMHRSRARSGGRSSGVEVWGAFALSGGW